MSQHVFVAMSGGVDSAVTALLLKEAGYQVSGIHLELSPNPLLKPQEEHSDLEKTCDILKVPLHYLHLENDFKDRIVDYFCEEYSLGKTPNPCVRCNRVIKFGLLLQRIIELGGDLLATGHYARVENREGTYHLLKGLDSTKDQSYFLYVLSQDILSKVLFPLGGMRKTAVKALAAQKGLPPAVRKESQDVCFVPDNDHKAFLATHVTFRPGDIVDNTGKTIGSHQGLGYYTVGQRQGMGISSGERLYVVEMDAEKNRLIIGKWDELLKSDLTAAQVNWLSGQAPVGFIRVTAKIRYRANEAPATVNVQGAQAKVHFDTPQRAIAPGQSVVFYQGDEVLGGGIIEKTG
jgi:tRNA-uridine 2-sulfurtransferase